MTGIADELPLISAMIAMMISKQLSTDEVNYYGNLLASIGADMLTIGAARGQEEKS